MNTANLKDFAPAARTLLLEAVKNRALKVGVTPTRVEPLTVEGDFVSIGGIRYPRRIADLRTRLLTKISRDGFDAVMEEAAYTWFNRLVAIRYMELQGYLKHGYRVLSDPTGAVTPEILSQAQNVDIAGLDKTRVLELLADGSKQEELYQLLLLAQCHELSVSMPFLFDRIDGANELLTPDGLLAAGSIIRKIVKDIPEEDWQTTEILGWLYQFYVSQEKLRIDGELTTSGYKGVKKTSVSPEDIPAKTQLFTPNWIVQFMVQNSLGRLWMDVYPTSDLASKMPYYCHPAEQEPEVKRQIKSITPKELDPTKLTAIDPAAGSGHILLELYNLFFEMYREQGYLPAEIPRQIVEKNLFGLELDRRAAQIAGFAVLMRARKDDPLLLENPPTVNVVPIRHSRDLDLSVLLEGTPPEAIVPSESLFEELDSQRKLTMVARPLISNPGHIRELCQLFYEADTQGSLIRIPEHLYKHLGNLEDQLTLIQSHPNLYASVAVRDLCGLVKQASLLGREYTFCVANPPYLGGTQMVKSLKDFAQVAYPTTKSALENMFLERGFAFAEESGFNAMITMQSWMFLTGKSKEGSTSETVTIKNFRHFLLESKTIQTLAHFGSKAFAELKGDLVKTVATVFRNRPPSKHRGVYYRLVDGGEDTKSKLLREQANRFDDLLQRDFLQIPGWPIAYWAQRELRDAFLKGSSLGILAKPRQGMATGNTEKHLRMWHEVSYLKIKFDATSVQNAITSHPFRWFPINKGGKYRRWYGNNEFVVNFSAKDYAVLKASGNHCPSESLYFLPGCSWTKISSGSFAARYDFGGYLFSDAGMKVFHDDESTRLQIAALLNSKIAPALLSCLSETVNFEQGAIERLPLVENLESTQLSRQLIQEYKSDWDSTETSWDFQRPSFFNESSSPREGYCFGEKNRNSLIETLCSLETQNNLQLLEAYGLQNVLDPQVLENDLTLRPFSEEVFAKALVSYFIGCAMGRYSLDKPGLIYAHQGSESFEPTKYSSFPADSIGMVPITDVQYFGRDDAAIRFADWVSAAWPSASDSDGLSFIADALGPRKILHGKEETSVEVIRRYLATTFYQDHLQLYKNRPIYWMVSSGDGKAFQCLLYLHRYNAGTLSKLRNEYVTKFIGQLTVQVDDAKNVELAAENASSKVEAATHLKKMQDQLEELLEFDKKLNHYALEQIELDLDDGVKVNYGKFSDPKVGDLLAKVKEITGGKDD